MQKSGNLESKARIIRGQILKMHTAANSSHLGSALSCVDLLVALFFSILHINPKKPDQSNRDRFILSKGHACSALYATLVKKGFACDSRLQRYCLNGGSLPGHSTKDCIAGVEATTGSLGHGLSMGIGMAIAAKFDKLKSRIFVLLSDGECNEGSVWEAAMFAAQHKLDNLTAIIDYNKLQAFGRTREIINLEPFAKKWQSFGWGCREINGHRFKEIISGLGSVPLRKNKPSCIIAHTVKGKGVSFMEDRLEWHYKVPTKEQLEMALREISSR